MCAFTNRWNCGTNAQCEQLDCLTGLHSYVQEIINYEQSK